VPLDRANDAQRLDREMWPKRQQGGIGPIERRMRELGGVQALVVGAREEGRKRKMMKVTYICRSPNKK
jgi:hypothetical protein